MIKSILSILVLDYKKETETRICLESIRKKVKIPYTLIYLDNGSNEDYPWQFYKEGLCDVLISKKIGMGGGFGQSDLIRFCDSIYFLFIQNDQELIEEINENNFKYFVDLLSNGYKCINLNGGQNGNNWTDRAHLMETDFFNSLTPFPNGGPGFDDIPWNEAYLVEKFKENNWKIAFIRPLFFRDNGKFSFRECGKNKEGLTVHRCDNKQMWVIKSIKEKCDVFPPLNDKEFNDMINGNWPIWGKDNIGRVPEAWSNNIFEYWK